MTFVRSVLGELGRRLLLVLSALLTVAFVEKFEHIARFALEFGVSLRGFIWLQIVALPAALEFMLPISTVVACYLVILSLRERREFIALASAGGGPGRLVAIAVAAALAVTVVGVVASGFVKPASNHAFRRHYEEEVAAVITKGLDRGRFFPIENRVIQVLADEGTSGRHIRVFDFEQGRSTAIHVADCVGMHLEAPMIWGDDCSMRSYSFAPQSGTAAATSVGPIPAPNCEACGEEDRSRLSVRVATIRRTSRAFEAAGLLNLETSEKPEEQGLFRLFRTEGEVFASVADARLAVKGVLLGFSNLVAVICAVAGVAFSSLKTRLIAPTMAIVASLIGIVVTGAGSLLPEAVFRPGATALFLSGTFCLLVAVLVATITLLHERLISPGMKRA